MDIHCQEDRCDFITREQCPIIAGIFPNNVDTIQVIWNTDDQTLQESETCALVICNFLLCGFW